MVHCQVPHRGLAGLDGGVPRGPMPPLPNPDSAARFARSLEVTCGGMGKPLRGRSAFTLIELLVVVAIVILLAAVLLPSLAAARQQAKLTTCKANLKQIGTIIAEYQTESASFVP